MAPLKTPVDLSPFLSRSLPNVYGVLTAETVEPISYPKTAHNLNETLETTSFWFSHRRLILAEAMTQFPPRGLIFDVGGGSGGIVAHLLSQGIEAVLIEPDPTAIHAAKKKGIPTIIQGSLQNIPFQPGVIPAMGAFDVLEHIQNEDEFLTRLHTLLAPGGRLYMTLPAYQSLWSTEDVWAGHFRRYNKGEIVHRLGKQGFRIEYVTPFFISLVLPIFLLRRIPYFLNIRRQENDYKESHRASHIARFILDLVGRYELRKVRDRKTLPFGSSFLVVASKI